MTVYLGKNPVGVGRIVEKKVAKEKFGATVDSFLGDVDADGNYVIPSEPVEINLAGVKSVPAWGFMYRFAKLQKLRFEANDIEEITSELAFSYCFVSSVIESLVFGKLKKITANQAFQYAFENATIKKPLGDIFPALEEISGFNAINLGPNYFQTIKDAHVMSKIKKITGATANYSSIFGSLYAANTIWNFPNATEFTGYIWNVSTSYPGEIHFAAANQAAIEACEGYDYKWGFAGATIYFDL